MAVLGVVLLAAVVEPPVVDVEFAVVAAEEAVPVVAFEAEAPSVALPVVVVAGMLLVVRTGASITCSSV